MKLWFRINKYYVGKKDRTWYLDHELVIEDHNDELSKIDSELRSLLTRDPEARIKDRRDNLEFVGFYSKGDLEVGYLLQMVPQEVKNGSVHPVETGECVHFIASLGELEGVFRIKGEKAVERILRSGDRQCRSLRAAIKTMYDTPEWIKAWEGPFEIVQFHA